jgi:uncharacterized membrane protein
MNLPKQLRSWYDTMYNHLDKVTVGFIVLYTIAALIVVLSRYWQSQVFYFDFGIFDTAIWKVAHFQKPLVDHYEYGDTPINILATHFYPSIFLFSPLYWLTNKQEILLIAQTLCVTGGAWFAYLIAKKSLVSKYARFALIVAFLMYVGLQNAIITEFHETVLAILPMMVLFWSIVTKKWRWYWIALIILLGLKETFTGFGILIGVYLFLHNRLHWKQSIATILVSSFWLILTFTVVIPFFSGGIPYHYAATSYPSTIVDFINAWFEPDIKWKTVLYSLATFGFLPLFDLTMLPILFEHFLERFILSDSPNRWLLAFHYNAPLSPIMFMGALNVFVLLEKRGWRRFVNIYSLLIIATALILHRFILHGPLQLVFNHAFYQQIAHTQYVRDFETHFPKSGVVMTQNDLAARLTHTDVRLMRMHYQLINPDFIIMNLTPGQNPNSFTPLSSDDMKETKDLLLLDNNYSVQKYGDELYIFTKNKK